MFAKLPRIDAVFVPGGDPGHTQPKHLMALLEKQTASLRKYHPKAQMWVSPQGFTTEWMDEFYGILKTEPAWLTGVVFGPQVRDSLPVLRANVPKRYPIRHYPDITHSLRSQYPVQDWDVAYALTSQREQINPRPVDEAVIFRALMPYATDFITYSEGRNDDVNKFVWSGLGWDPKADVLQILREYSRYFIGDRYTDSFAQGLLALERNWRGPLAANASVYTTLEQFQAMERAAAPRDLLNWRFQQALYRAYYDAYVRSRLLHETAIEERALERLRAAKAGDSRQALADAGEDPGRGAGEARRRSGALRVYTLAEALFQSIRQQLSVDALPRHRGRTRRHARQLRDAAEQRRLAARAVRRGGRARTRKPSGSPRSTGSCRWTDPGPGGFYDDLGNPAQQPHLVRGPAVRGRPAAPQVDDDRLRLSAPTGGCRG